MSVCRLSAFSTDAERISFPEHVFFSVFSQYFAVNCRLCFLRFKFPSVLYLKMRNGHVPKQAAFLNGALQIFTALIQWSVLTAHPKAFFTLSCFLLPSVSTLSFINSCNSHLLMLMLPLLSVPLKAFFLSGPLFLSTQRDSECNIKAIHKPQVVLSAISIPAPQRWHHQHECPSRSLVTQWPQRLFFPVKTQRGTSPFKTKGSLCLLLHFYL